MKLRKLKKILNFKSKISFKSPNSITKTSQSVNHWETVVISYMSSYWISQNITQNSQFNLSHFFVIFKFNFFLLSLKTYYSAQINWFKKNLSQFTKKKLKKIIFFGIFTTKQSFHSKIQKNFDGIFVMNLQWNFLNFTINLNCPRFDSLSEDMPWNWVKIHLKKLSKSVKVNQISILKITKFMKKLFFSIKISVNAFS